MLLLGFYSCKKDVHDKLLFVMSTDLYMAGNSKTPMFWILPWWNLTTPCLPFYCGFTLDRGRHSGVEFGLTTRIFWRGFMPMGSSLSQRTLLPFNLKHKLIALIIFMLIFILFVWSGIQALLKGIYTWNVRPLVELLFVPSAQQTSVLYCRLSDF